MSIRPRTKRETAMRDLFWLVVHFDKILFVGDTITRITLRTNIDKSECDTICPWLKTHGIEFLALALENQNIE